MNYDRILIRYGELSTKGRNRSQFIQKLANSIRRALHDFPNVAIRGTRDRTYILLNGEDGHLIKDALDKTIATGEGQTIWMKSIGVNEDGVVVSTFKFEWTLKLKVKD